MSSFAPVTIGDGCIISERATIGLQLLTESTGSTLTEKGVVLEKNVVIESGAIVQAALVGNGTTIGAGVNIGPGVVIGKHCKIGPLCEIGAGEVLEDFTIVYGYGERRKEKPGLEGVREKTHEKHLEMLRRLIPSNLVRWQSP
jgi:dynactin-6